MKKLKLLFLTLAVLLAGLLGYMFINFLPIMTGMAAKTMCSCVYVLHREPESVKKMELSVFPGLSRATFTYNYADSTISARLLGKESKAVFRRGLGCTLLAGKTLEELKQQAIVLPTVPNNQDSIAWPAGDKLSDSLIAGVNYQQIRDAVDSAFVDVDPSKPIYTLGVVVVFRGSLIAEKYASGFTKDSRMMGWSMTKSITNALVGILVRDGRLKTEAPAPVNEWAADARKEITLNNLLQASSGLEWSETYFLPGDFHNMFMFSDDKGGYAAQKSAKYKPNEHFEYSSGTANILSRIVRQSVGDRDYYQFPYRELFYKIGMNHAILEPDASGTFVGSSYGYASARDWARFGLLFLQDGVWMGKRILPEGWVKYSSTPAPAAPLGEYGAHWWLNAGPKGNPQNKKYKDLPNEVIMADGFERQHVVIVPSKSLVIVRLGVTHNGNFHLGRLVGSVMKALP